MNVPKLRFKEFTNEYKKVKFGDIVNYQKGFAFRSGDYKNNGIRVIRVSDTTNNSIKKDNAIYISEDEANKHKSVELLTNDIIISSVGSKPPLYDSMVGKVILVPDFENGSLLNQNAIRFRAKIDNQTYLYHYLKQNKYIKFIESIMRGNANQRSITVEDLLNFQLVVPSLKEQIKVGNLLLLLDKKIELQIKKIEALKLFKSYTKSEIFKNGNHVCKLGAILNKWNKKNKDGAINYVESISNKAGFIPQSEQFEDRNVASKNLRNYYVIKKGVFGYNPSRLNVGSLALKENDSISVVSPLYECFTTTQNNTYLFEWFNSNYFKKETSSRFEGGVRNTLNFSNLCDILINLPDIETQNKYAKYFNKLNFKISLEEQKLSKLLKYKKALLQDMFI